MILAIFDLKVSPIIFWVNEPFYLGEIQNRFSRRQLLRPSYISDRNEFCYFCYFWFISQLDDSYLVLSQLAFQFRRNKLDFQDGGHPGFQIGSILAIFHLPVNPVLPTEFRLKWPFGSEEDVKNRFSKWPSWWPPWISDWNGFSYFWSTNHPGDSYQALSQLPFRFRRRTEK